MRSQFNRIPGGSDRRTQRAVVLQVLRDDRRERWSSAELQGELGGLELGLIDRAIAGLAASGVVHAQEGVVCASDAARHLDELELIGV